jgi:hypothetical protein
MDCRWRIVLVLLLVTIAGLGLAGIYVEIHNSRVIFATTDPGAVPTLSRTPEPKASEMVETQGSASINVGSKISAMTSDVLYTPIPSATQYYWPVKSIDDVPQVVLNDPFFRRLRSEAQSGDCILTSQPSGAVWVNPWADSPGYYIVPFFDVGQLCAYYNVYVENGLGQVSMWTEGRGKANGGKHFPSAGAREAQAVIEQHTGKRVIGKPRLVAVPFPPNPAWEVVTRDGETYYVNFLTVKVNVDGTEEVRVWAWNAKNDFRVGLDGSPNFIYIRIGEPSIPY